ncbi:hypothetical protein ACHAWF_009798 [Thalassiosira exigua]
MFLPLLDGQRVASETNIHMNRRGVDDNSAAILDDFDLSATATCGAHKCFFRSKNNASTGYLAAANAGYSEDMFEQWSATKRLEAKYEIRHFLLEPPRRVNVTHGFAKRLTGIVAEQLDANDGHNSTHMYLDKIPVVVQKSETFPLHSLHVGCGDGHLRVGLRNLLQGQFVASVGTDAFLDRLRGELKHAAEMLDEEPWAAPDFQFVVGSRGEIYVTDLGWFVENLDYGGAKTAEWSERSSQKEWQGKCRRVFDGLLRGFAASWKHDGPSSERLEYDEL